MNIEPMIRNRLHELLAHCEERNVDLSDIPAFLSEFGRVELETATGFVQNVSEEEKKQFRTQRLDWRY